MSILDKIMKPKSIAVIGASTKEHTIGSDIMKRLQEYNFNGKIYPVNPKGGIIEGTEFGASVLFDICVPSETVDEFTADIIDFTNGIVSPIPMGDKFMGVRIR